MKLSTIQKKAAAKAARLGRYDISDGVHRGQIASLEYNDKNDRVYLKIQLNGEDTVYKSSAELADYGNKPLNKLLEPFVDDDGSVDFDDIVGYDVTFTTKTNVSKDGNQFSNIVDIDYIYEDGVNEED